MAFLIFPLNLVQLFLFFGLQIHILANDHKIVLAKMIVQRPLAVQLVSKGLLDPNRWRRLLDNSSPREVTMDALMIVSDLALMDKGFYEYINRASVLEHMKDFLTHEDPHVRVKTCSALGNMCRHSSYFYNSFARYQIICLLIDRCSDPDKRTRKFACFAIAQDKTDGSSGKLVGEDEKLKQFLQDRINGISSIQRDLTEDFQDCIGSQDNNSHHVKVVLFSVFCLMCFCSTLSPKSYFV
ncbi:hypothetical protein UlMin_019418 [Ulmus minor]